MQSVAISLMSRFAWGAYRCNTMPVCFREEYTQKIKKIGFSGNLPGLAHDIRA
jgi:hypothetical protein